LKFASTNTPAGAGTSATGPAAGADPNHLVVAPGIWHIMNVEGHAAIIKDAIATRALGINGTPTFLFGHVDEQGGVRVTRRESGAIPYEAFSKVLDEVLAKRVPPS
jgi:hypothetical protein